MLQQHADDRSTMRRGVAGPFNGFLQRKAVAFIVPARIGIGVRVQQRAHNRRRAAPDGFVKRQRTGSRATGKVGPTRRCTRDGSRIIACGDDLGVTPVAV